MVRLVVLTWLSVAGKIAVGFFRSDCGGVFSGYDDLARLGLLFRLGVKSLRLKQEKGVFL